MSFAESATPMPTGMPAQGSWNMGKPGSPNPQEVEDTFASLVNCTARVVAVYGGSGMGASAAAGKGVHGGVGGDSTKGGAGTGSPTSAGAGGVYQVPRAVQTPVSLGMIASAAEIARLAPEIIASPELTGFSQRMGLLVCSWLLPGTDAEQEVKMILRENRGPDVYSKVVACVRLHHSRTFGPLRLQLSRKIERVKILTVARINQGLAELLPMLRAYSAIAHKGVADRDDPGSRCQLEMLEMLYATLRNGDTGIQAVKHALYMSECKDEGDKSLDVAVRYMRMAQSQLMEADPTCMLGEMMGESVGSVAENVDVSKLICFNCGKAGHRAKDCHEARSSRQVRADIKKKIDEARQRRSKGAAGQPRGGQRDGARPFRGNCNHCGKRGHLERDCFKKKQEMEAKAKAAKEAKTKTEASEKAQAAGESGSGIPDRKTIEEQLIAHVSKSLGPMVKSALASLAAEGADSGETEYGFVVTEDGPAWGDIDGSSDEMAMVVTEELTGEVGNISETAAEDTVTDAEDTVTDAGATVIVAGEEPLSRMNPAAAPWRPAAWHRAACVIQGALRRWRRSRREEAAAQEIMQMVHCSGVQPETADTVVLERSAVGDPWDSEDEADASEDDDVAVLHSSMLTLKRNGGDYPSADPKYSEGIGLGFPSDMRSVDERPVVAGVLSSDDEFPDLIPLGELSSDDGIPDLVPFDTDNSASEDDDVPGVVTDEALHGLALSDTDDLDEMWSLPRLVTRSEAIVRIQAMVRGHQLRRHFLDEVLDASATRIQSLVRGYQLRGLLFAPVIVADLDGVDAYLRAGQAVEEIKYIDDSVFMVDEEESRTVWDDQRKRWRTTGGQFQLGESGERPTADQSRSSWAQRIRGTLEAATSTPMDGLERVNVVLSGSQTCHGGQRRGRFRVGKTVDADGKTRIYLAQIDTGACRIYSGFPEHFGSNSYRKQGAGGVVGVGGDVDDAGNCFALHLVEFLDEHEGVVDKRLVEMRFLPSLGPRILFGTDPLLGAHPGNQLKLYKDAGWGSCFELREQQGGVGGDYQKIVQIPLHSEGAKHMVRLRFVDAMPTRAMLAQGAPEMAAASAEQKVRSCLPRKGAVTRGSLQFWHTTLNHRSRRVILPTVEQARGAMVKDPKVQLPFCGSCCAGKGRRPGGRIGQDAMDAAMRKLVALHRRELNDRKRDGGRLVSPELKPRPMEIIAVDAFSISNIRLKPFGPKLKRVYFNVFVCVATGMLWVFPAATKRDILIHVRSMVEKARMYELAIRALRHDGDGTQTSDVFRRLLAELGIQDQLTMANAQYQNGIAERAVGQLCDDARTVLWHAKLDAARYAVAAVMDVAMKHNVIVQRGRGGRSPYQLFFGQPPDLKRFVPYGSSAWVFMPQALRPGGSQYTTKLGGRAIEGLVVACHTGLGGGGAKGLTVRSLYQEYRTESAYVQDLTQARAAPPVLAQDGLPAIAAADSVHIGGLDRFGLPGSEARDLHEQLGLETDWGTVGRSNPTLGLDHVEGLDMPGPIPVVPPMRPMSVPSVVPTIGQAASAPAVDATKVVDLTLGGKVSDSGGQATVGASGGMAPTESKRPSTASVVPIVRRSSRRNRGVPATKFSDQYVGAAAERSRTVLMFEPEEVLEVDENGHINGDALDDGRHVFRVVERADGSFDFVSLHVKADDRLAQEAVRDAVGNPDREFVGKADGKKSLTFKQAITNNRDIKDRAGFMDAAMKEWYDNLIKAGVLKYVDRSEVPDDAVPVPLGWVFVHKIDPLTGEVKAHKGRVFIQGDVMQAGLHYNPHQVHSPTVTFEAVKVAMVEAKLKGYPHMAADVSAAFTKMGAVNANFFFTPEGMAQLGADGRERMVKGLMMLYGDPTAAYRWMYGAMSEMMKLGFRSSLWDPCLIRSSVSKLTAEEVKSIGRKTAVKTEDKAMVAAEEKSAVMADGLTDDVMGEIEEVFSGIEIGPLDMVEQLHEVEYESEMPDTAQFDFKQLISSQKGNEVEEHVWIVITIYVDDLFAFSNDQEYLRIMLQAFLTRFPGKFKSDPDTIVGLGMRSDGDGEVTLVQPALAASVVESAGMESCKPAATPLVRLADPVQDRAQSEDERRKVQARMDIPRVLGKAGFLRWTRPDLLLMIANISRVSGDAGVGALEMMKRGVRYIQGSKSVGVTFGRQTDHGLVAFVDTSYDVTTFTFVTVFWRGGCIYARAMRQKFVQPSTMLVELAGLMEAGKIVQYMAAIIADVGIRDIGTPRIFCDNTAAVTVVKNPYKTSKEVRHFRIRLAWLKQGVAAGDFTVEVTPTAVNVADIGTKPVDTVRFRDLRSQLMGWAPLKRLCDATES